MVWSQIFTLDFLASVIRMTTPILFAALGGLIARRAGILNLALEGTMLTSSLIGVLVSGTVRSAALGGELTSNSTAEAIKTANMWGTIAGVAAGILAGIMISLLLALMAIKLKANITLAGIAINLFATGFTPFLCQVVTGNKANSSGLTSTIVPQIIFKNLDKDSVWAKLFSGHYALTYVAIIGIVFVYFLMYRTPTGLRIRAVGENPHAAESVGINVTRVQVTSLVYSGIFCALGGIFLSMSYVNFWVRNITASRGFVGMAAMNLGNAEPIGSSIAALVFGFFDALAVNLRVASFPTEFIAMIPYVATLLGLILYAINQNRKLKKLHAQK